MAPTILHAVILQATSRSMIFRKCAECTNKIIGVAQNVELRSVGVLYYCPECDKDVDKYKANYDLQMIVSVSNGQKIQQAAVYDEGVSTILGCSADKLCEVIIYVPSEKKTRSFVLQRGCHGTFVSAQKTKLTRDLSRSYLFGF